MNRKVGRNDPCPCGSGKKFKRCCGRSSPPPPPDRRLMERDLRALGKLVEGQEFESFDKLNAYLQQKASEGGVKWTPETPLEQAQELVYQALETSERRERIRLAMKALKISQDCADAYVLLAEEAAETPEQACNFYRQGVKAGERALGDEAFRDDAGHFWGVMETRPYMRARAGLAQCLWLLGDKDEAISHCEDMLRLNPNDNQGIRYVLLAYFLEMGQVDRAEGLLAQYEGDGRAAWLFSRALVRFIRQGDSKEARQALREAMAANKHVAPYLLRQRRMPWEHPKYIEIGHESEAVEYVEHYKAVWDGVPGALAWLAAQAAEAPAHPRGLTTRAGGGVQLGLGPSPTRRSPARVPGRRPEEGPAPTLEEWGRLYRAAIAFKEQQPWKWVTDDELFGVQDPETGEVGYCSIMGELGEVLGMGVFLGPEGFQSYWGLIEGKIKAGELEAETIRSCLLASFDDRESLSQRDLAVIRELGLRFRGRQAWPQFRSLWPGFAPWYLTWQEARFLAAALEQAIDVVKRVRDGLDLFEEVDENLVLVREWDPAGKIWRDAWQPLPLPPGSHQPATTFDESRLRRLKEACRKAKGAWQVDLYSIPTIVGVPGQRPYYPKVWLCVDSDTGFVMDTSPLEPWRSPAEFQEAFISILEGAPWLPAVLVVARPATKELLIPLAQKLGIQVREQRRLAALEKAKKSLARFTQR